MASGTGMWYGSTMTTGSSSARRYVNIRSTSFNESNGVTTLTLDIGTHVDSGNFQGSHCTSYGSFTDTYQIYGEGYYGAHDGLTWTCAHNRSINFYEGCGYTSSSAGYISSTVSFTWYPTLKTYSVAYNANGGSGAPSSQTKTWGTNITLSSTKPTRTGYTFKNWNTKSDGSGTSYAAGATYSANAATTLYAIWQINTWTVSYNGNGSTGGSTASQTKTYGQTLTLRSNGFTRTNYVFKNWNTAANGSGTTYSAGGSYTANAATTLYAQWYAPYSVTFDANGGANAPASQVKVYNTALTITSSVPTRAGYRFVNWNTKADGTGTTYASGASYTANANLALYAQWQLTASISLDVARCTATGGVVDAYDDMGPCVECACTWSLDAAASGVSLLFACGSNTETVSISGSSGTNTVVMDVGARADTPLSVTVTLTDDQGYTGSFTKASSTAYTNPAVTSLLCVRTDSQGALQDDGEHMRVDVGWRVAYLGSQTVPTSILITATDNGTTVASETVTTFTGTVSGSAISGTTSLVMSAGAVFDPDVKYGVAVGLADSLKTVPVGDVLSTAYFPFDVLMGGHGIGLGKPATQQDLLDVGFDANFDGDVEVGGEVAITTSEITRDTVPSANVWPVERVRFNDSAGSMIGHVRATARTDGYEGMQFETLRYVNDTEIDHALRLEIDASGTRRVSIHEQAPWRSALGTLAAVDANGYWGMGRPDGNTSDWIRTTSSGIIPYQTGGSGALGTSSWFFNAIYGKEHHAKSANLDRDGTNPSSDTYGTGIYYFRDKDNETLGMVRPWINTSGRVGIQIGANTEKTDGTSVWNWFQVYIAKDGTASYGVTSPANFRSAISAPARTTQLYNNTSGSNGTITLSATAANYTWLRIFFFGKSAASGAATRYCSVDVHSPNGKIVQLSCIGPSKSGASEVILHTKMVTISATSVTSTSYYNAGITSSGTTAGGNNEIYITRVEGWTN